MACPIMMLLYFLMFCRHWVSLYVLSIHRLSQRIPPTFISFLSLGNDMISYVTAFAIWTETFFAANESGRFFVHFSHD